MNIGTDIVFIPRIEKVIKKWGKRFLERVFSSEEIKYCIKKQRPEVCFAGRFAAKEAIFKALGREDMAFKDIEIISEGPPFITLNKREKPSIKVSISHDENYAVATAIVEN